LHVHRRFHKFTQIPVFRSADSSKARHRASYPHEEVSTRHNGTFSDYLRPGTGPRLSGSSQ